jgi:hypothetical protein
MAAQSSLHLDAPHTQRDVPPMLRAAFCVLLAIPAIACGGRSDLLDVPGDVDPPDARACSVAFATLSSELDTSLVDAVPSADLIEGQTPSIFVDCQGSAARAHYEVSGRYEIGRNTMQMTSRENGFSRGPTYNCTVQAQVNGAPPRADDRYAVGDEFSLTFNCLLVTIDAILIPLDGTLSAPLTAN